VQPGHTIDRDLRLAEHTSRHRHHDACEHNGETSAAHARGLLLREDLPLILEDLALIREDLSQLATDRFLVGEDPVLPFTCRVCHLSLFVVFVVFVFFVSFVA
jgi:hypothetical protein